jgi:hypothetical protein
MRDDVDVGPVFAAVRVRARDRCENCGANGGRAVHMLEGVPGTDDTLWLCDVCEEPISRELGTIADMRAFHEAIARIVARRRSMV